MTQFTRHDFLQLTAPEGETCVSLYCPLEGPGRILPQDAIRMKNLLQQAERQLVQAGMRSATAKGFVQEVRNRLDELDFWSISGRSAAVFFSPEDLFAYRLNPMMEESVTVGRRFRVRPLLDALETEEPLYVLQLGSKNVGLYRVAEQKVEVVDVPHLPRDREETLNYDNNDRGAQVHSADRALRGKQAAVFHGHGGIPDTAKQDLESFLRRQSQPDGVSPRRRHAACSRLRGLRWLHLPRCEHVSAPIARHAVGQCRESTSRYVLAASSTAARSAAVGATQGRSEPLHSARRQSPVVR